MRAMLRLVLLVLMATFASANCRAADHAPCEQLDRNFPQPGRDIGGDNAYRPLPVFSPVRALPALPGTLSLSIDVDHVSSAASGKPGYLYVGNYEVTNIPAFRMITGANTTVQVTRPEDGRVFHISDACLASSDWEYGGSTWALEQGDTLDVLLQSRLDYTGDSALTLPTNGAVPCRASNLHTHGLLVSPYHPQRAGNGDYGDYVLDVTQPRGSMFGVDTDDCGTQLGRTEHRGHQLTSLPLHTVTLIPGRQGVNSLDSGQHPSGLFWYHPHPHGFSGSQIGGGTTGAITVGSLTDYACPAGEGSRGHCAIDDADTRIMVLKDAEIEAYGTNWATIPGYESGLCSNKGGKRFGECQGVEGNTGPTKWVFTINGVQYPVVRVPPGRLEIWRLVNASQGMTYSLSIESNSPDHKALPFQVLAVDGVSVAQPQDHGILRTRVLMMPSSRVEIAIPAPADGGSFTLRNNAVQTGGNGYGDIWPQVDLARFDWAKPHADAPRAQAAPLQISGPATPLPQVAEVVDGPPGPCTFKPGDKRVIYFTHRFVKVSADAAKAAPGHSRRTVNEVFGLIAGVRHPDGSEDFYNESQKGVVLHNVQQVWDAGTEDGDPAFPGFMHNDWGTICSVKGNIEPWELINFTGEDHNFHIHQSRFALDPNGEFVFPRAGEKAAHTLRVTDDQVRDFADLTMKIFHDNIPVPRGQTDCADDPNATGCHGDPTTECTGIPDRRHCPHPGKMSVIMDFSRAEQVGSFVYHCHIMEHEDGGMMAMIRVLCPRGDASCAAQQTAQAICRPPAEE